MPLWDWLFGGVTDLPRGAAMGWRSDWITLHALADAVIALSFFAIPLGIVFYLRRRRGLLHEYRLVAWLFGGFILVCGVTHLIGVLSLWYPIHGMEGLSKALTAVLSGAAVGLIWPLLPALVRQPSSRQLAEVNERLRREAEAHEATLRELEAARRELEERVEARTRELSVANARFEIALHGSNVTVYTQDKDLRYTSVSGPMFGREVDEILGRSDDEILPAESRGPIRALKRAVLDSAEPRDGEFRIAETGGVGWYDMHIEPLRDGAGEIAGLTCAAVDITGRKAGEAHLRDLMRELTHRSKNLLAVIQAMARQTARHAGSEDAFLEQFSARLQALAASHDLLVQESWHGASLAELARSQLGHHLDREGAQVSLQGPSLLLKPEAAQSLGLALHELATNATKYGALSVPSGRVAMTWRWVPQDSNGAIEITWSESGGPCVAAPDGRGFGSLVIERNLARSLDAHVDLSFRPDGVQCRMLIPADNLAPAS